MFIFLSITLLSIISKKCANAQGLSELSMVSADYTAKQSLLNQQKINVSAPAKVKIDGNPSEWQGFQAYNNKTDIFTL